MTWEDVSATSEKGVHDPLFPEQAELEAAKAHADYDHVHGELQRDGVTLLVLWEEYRDQAVAETSCPRAALPSAGAIGPTSRRTT